MTRFSLEHNLWIFSSVVFALLCGLFYFVPHDSKKHRYFRWSLFSLVFCIEIPWRFFRHYYLQVPLHFNLPLQISSIAILNLFCGLSTRKPIFCSLAYFIATFGVSMAIFSPHISETGWVLPIAVPRFFITHMATFGVGFYLTFGIRYFPSFKDFLRTYALLMLYAFCLIPLNNYLGTNYFYANHPPRELPAFTHGLPQALYSLYFSIFFFVPYFLFWIPLGYLHRRNN